MPLPRVAVYRSPVLPLSETFIRDQIRALTRWDAVLVGETLMQSRPDIDGVPRKTLYQDTRWGRLIRRTDRVLERLRGASSNKRNLIASTKPNVIHVHFATDAVNLWPSVQGLGLPMVVTLHGYDVNTHASWWRDGNGGRWMRDYPDRLLAMSGSPSVYFVAVSEAIRQTAIAYGLPADRIKVLKIGIHTSLFPVQEPPPSRRPKDVLFVGRLIEKKGAIYLLEAGAKLKARVDGVRFIFLGEGPQRESLTQRARELGLTVEFLGAQPHSEVSRRLGTVRALCLPSITAESGDAEGLPIVVLEAQAAGVPVITSARGGKDEGIVDRQTGFAFEERNVDQLADALEVLMTDGPQADLMGQQAAAFIRAQFEIYDCTRRLEDFYDEVSGAVA